MYIQISKFISKCVKQEKWTVLLKAQSILPLKNDKESEKLHFCKSENGTYYKDKLTRLCTRKIKIASENAFDLHLIYCYILSTTDLFSKVGKSPWAIEFFFWQLGRCIGPNTRSYCWRGWSILRQICKKAKNSVTYI